MTATFDGDGEAATVEAPPAIANQSEAGSAEGAADGGVMTASTEVATPTVSVPERAPGAPAGIAVEQTVQHSSGTVVGVIQNVIRKMLDYHDLTPEYVAACVKAFAAPSDIADVVERFRRDHIVVIVAESNSGRHDTAVYLLRAIDGVTLREVRREPGDRIDVAAVGVERASGWLLDLRNDERIEHTFARSLVHHQEQLRSRHSYLAVVMTPALWQRAGSGGEHLEYRLRPPRAADVVRSRLAALDPPIHAEPYVTASAITHRLSAAEPAEALRWAEAIEKVHTSDVTRDGEDPARLTEQEIRDRRIDTVVKVCANWRAHLLDWHKQQADSRARNFLLAAAVLEGQPAGEIFEAATDIAVALGEPAPQVQGQQGAGILELVDRVGARLPDEQTVRFTQPGYGEAILDYFWIDRQHLQTQFVSWMCQLPAKLAAGEAEEVTDRIATYLLRWTVRHRSLKLLRVVTPPWASDPILRDAARQLLTAAALHAQVGKLVRDELLEWAKDDSTTVEVQQLTAEVCGGELARIYPRMALYRLAQLAKNTDPAVAEAVTTAISQLWRQPGVRDQILKDIASWCCADDPARQEAGQRVFLALAGVYDPERDTPELIAHTATSGGHAHRGTLVTGWRTVLTTRSVPEPAGHVIVTWLDSALHNPQLRPVVTDVLTAAVHGTDPLDTDLRRFTNLTGLLFLWAPANHPDPDSQRRHLRDEILERIVESNSALHHLRGTAVGSNPIDPTTL